jgi:hypothetical protein
MPPDDQPVGRGTTKPDAATMTALESLIVVSAMALRSTSLQPYGLRTPISGQ